MTIRANLVEMTNRIHSLATAEGLTARGHSPVLRLCRMLVMAGRDPAELMEVYRGDRLVMTISSIGDGAKLNVLDAPTEGPRFIGYRASPFGRGPQQAG